MSSLAYAAWALVLAVGPASGQAHKIAPQYGVGQELVYQGRITQTVTAADGAVYEQPFEVSARCLISGIDQSRVVDACCYTETRVPQAGGDAEELGDSLTGFHFDRVDLNSGGKIVWADNGAEIMMPPSGVSDWEMGYLVELPNEAVTVGQEWTRKRPGQPITRCEVEGTENVLGVRCVKVVAEQQSDDYEGVRGPGYDAWRSVTSYWCDPKSRTVMKVRRDYRIRPAGAEAATRRIVADYTQASNVRYHGETLSHRVSDFTAAYDAQNALAAELRKGSRRSGVVVKRMMGRLQSCMDKTYSTPYRGAIERMHATAVAAAADRKAFDAGPIMVSGASSRSVGNRVRRFVCRDLEADETVKSQELKGTAAVLVFLDPTDDTCVRTLRSVLKTVAADGEAKVRVYAVCAHVDEATAVKLRETVPGDYRLCLGTTSSAGYGGTGLPHTVFVDDAGIVQGNYVGFGPEMFGKLASALATQADVTRQIASEKEAWEARFRR